MRPVQEPSGEVPDLEIRGACIACGGDISVRLRPGASRCICRDCGCMVWALVDYDRDGLRVEPGSAISA